MMNRLVNSNYCIALLLLIAFSSCERPAPVAENALKPKVITEPAKHDTDDPAIWINEDDPANSLVIGTDKDEDGALVVYDLSGKILEDKTVSGLKRPNNVDIREIEVDDKEYSIAVTTERLTNKLRIFSLPDMKPVDNGGIEVFVGETERDPMGIALYKRESDDAVFAIVGRKTGPSGSYLWQYKLEGDGTGNIKATKVREFGQYSGKNEIEAIAVDDELGYIYYSDEGTGVRKYYADPDKGNDELALFATTGFAGDHEGISIYKLDIGTGYILVSDQQANKFHIYTREGTKENPHEHKEVKVIDVSTMESDGSEVTNVALNDQFPHGMFVAMSEGKTFHYYDWADIAGEDLIIAPDGIPKHSANALKPKVVTEPVPFDTDDPAIWIHPTDPEKSLVIGTDKEEGGGLYVFDLDGKIVNKVIGLHRPNNVDLGYGLKLKGKSTDFVITTERNNGTVRIFSFPDLKPIDNGGIAVFEGEEERDPMGVTLYTRPSDKAIFAIVGRKTGPSGSYLWQYRMQDDGTGNVKLTKVRAFGEFSGIKEIEALAVDHELGYVYCSDEGVGIRKYYADPEKGNDELAFFGQDDFGRDMEGISIYTMPDGTGYILVSDQQVGTFNIYAREGTAGDPHNHKLIKTVEVSTLESDGSDITSVALGPKFPNGLFVAMSTDKTFHFYDWADIAGSDLKILNK